MADLPARDLPMPAARASQAASEPRSSEDGTQPASQLEGEEVDLWRDSYAWLSMLPSLVLGALLTAIIVGVAWYLGAWRGALWARSMAQAFMGALWVGLLIVWSYRLLTVNYRLTTRRIFCERGFRHPGDPGLPLNHIAIVSVDFGLMDRILGVGLVRVITKDEQLPTLTLRGV